MDTSPSPAPTQSDPSPPRRRLPRILLVTGVVVALLAGGGLWWFFDRDNPDEVDLDVAAKGVTTTTAAAGASESSTPATDSGNGSASASGDLTGTWNVDTNSGEFDFESATGTFAGFRIKEELAGIGSTEAVGRTGDVSGSMTIDGTQVTAAEFTVDLTTITTNESMRDRRVQDALGTSQNPTATFRLTSPIDLGADASTASKVEVDAKGDLTVNGVTKSVTFPLQARLVDQTIVVVGSLDITFSDFGVEIPSSPRVVSVEDHGKVELQVLLTR